MSYTGPHTPPRDRRVSSDDWLLIYALAVAILAAALQAYRGELPLTWTTSRATASATTPAATQSPVERTYEVRSRNRCGHRRPAPLFSVVGLLTVGAADPGCVPRRSVSSGVYRQGGVDAEAVGGERGARRAVPDLVQVARSAEGVVHVVPGEVVAAGGEHRHGTADLSGFEAEVRAGLVAVVDAGGVRSLREAWGT